MSPEPALVRVSGADIGSRVVVRHLLPHGRATDVLGELLAAGPAGWRVRREDGEVVAIAGGDVVAARQIPPRPARRRGGVTDSAVVELEELAVAGWPPIEHEWLGRWLLRASAGFTGRGNSALLLGPAGRPSAEAIDGVEGYYRQRSLQPRVAVPTTATGRPLEAATDAELAGRGWVVDSPAVVMTASLAGASVAGASLAGASLDEASGERRGDPVQAPSLPQGWVLDRAAAPDPAWLAAYRYRGQPVPAAGLAVLTGSPLRVFASVRVGGTGSAGGEVLAVARGSVEAGWLGICAVEVVKRARRRGAARALLAALAGWGADQGAASAYLQVAADNDAARALYAGSGFTVHHGYHYRVPR